MFPTCNRLSQCSLPRPFTGNEAPMASTSPSDVVTVQRALLSVSDKRGLIELARAWPSETWPCWPAAARARLSLPARACSVAEVADLHRPARDPGRPGQDAAPQDPRRHPRPPRRPRRSRRLAAGDSTRSTWSSSISIRSRRPSPTRPRRSRTPIENIDIGGPTLIRAAAKNHAHVAVVTSPGAVRPPDRGQLQAHGGTTLAIPSARWPWRPSSRRASYDAAIAAYLASPATAGREQASFPPTS